MLDFLLFACRNRQSRLPLLAFTLLLLLLLPLLLCASLQLPLSLLVLVLSLCLQQLQEAWQGVPV